MTRRGRAAATVAVITELMLAPFSSRAQEPPRPFAALRQAVPHQSSASRLLEVRIRLDRLRAVRAEAGAAAPAAVTTRMGRLPRERQPELALDRLVVVLADSRGRELYWRIVANPQLVRFEQTGAGGETSGQTVALEENALSVALPDLPDAAAVHVYEPAWNGVEFLLRPVGSVRLENKP